MSTYIELKIQIQNNIRRRYQTDAMKTKKLCLLET